MPPMALVSPSCRLFNTTRKVSGTTKARIIGNSVLMIFHGCLGAKKLRTLTSLEWNINLHNGICCLRNNKELVDQQGFRYYYESSSKLCTVNFTIREIASWQNKKQNQP